MPYGPQRGLLITPQSVFRIAPIVGAFLLLAIVLPGVALAKKQNYAGYSFTEGRTTSLSVSLTDLGGVEDPITKTYLTVSSKKKIETEIDLYRRMAIIRINSAKPWHLFPRAKEVSVTLSGLIPGQTYYLYKEKLRNPEIFTPDASGSHTISLDTPRHRYLILKTNPSTFHIDSNSSTGGECTQIGAWDGLTKTCTLSATSTIDQIIEIDDGDITLDGGGRLITHTDSIGVYVNEDPFEPDIDNVTIKNVRVAGLDTGISLIDISNSQITDVTVKSDATGILIKDDTNITITNSTIWSDSVGISSTNSSNIRVYQNNFKLNTTDLAFGSVGLDLTGNGTQRGNWWDKHTCTQDTANPDHCTNSFDAGPANDNLPWACEDGWLSSTICPAVVTPPPPGPPPPPPINTDMQRPVDITDGKLRCNFPSYPGHRGIDIVGDRTATTSAFSTYTIYKATTTAAQDGKVIFASPPTSTSAGNYVWLFHGTTTRLNGTNATSTSSLYMHLESILVTENDIINQGDPIGLVGSTGDSTGPHLHFEVRQGSVIGVTDHRNLTVLNPQEFVDYPVESNSTLCVESHSPVILSVIDPDGLRIGPNSNQIGLGAQYWFFGNLETDFMGDDEYQLIVIDFQKEGQYQIIVRPKPTATLSETFTLEAYNSNSFITLANKLQVGSIGSTKTYLINVNAGNITNATTTGDGQNSKTAICHRPHGNPGNAHTITIGQPAVRAHLAHGDTMGACGTSTATTTETVKKTSPGQAKDDTWQPPGQAKKEDNTAGAGFIPPGQAKKKK